MVTHKIAVSHAARLRGWVIIAAIMAMCGSCVGFYPVQGLPSARLGVLARLDSSTPEPMTLTVSLPRGYGLTASERRMGLPPLNEPQQEEAVLGGTPVLVQMPSFRYCETSSLLTGISPPPVWLTLRFSDSPDEIYTVVGREYVVRDASGREVPKETATWKLTVGRLTSQQPARTPDRLWLLNVVFERQHHPPQPDGRAAQA